MATAMPAQLTATSTRPNFSFARVRAACTSFSELTFKGKSEESIHLPAQTHRHTHTTKPMGGGENYVSKVEAMRKPEGGIKLKMIGSTEQCFKTFFKFISSFDKFTYLWTFSIAVDESTVLRIIDIKISYLFCTPLLSIVCFMKFFDFVNIKSQSSIRILKLHNLSRFYYVQFPSPLCEG